MQSATWESVVKTEVKCGEDQSGEDLAQENARQSARDLFQIVDTDNGGEIEPDELQDLLACLFRDGEHSSDEAALNITKLTRQVFDVIDTDKSGTISQDEVSEFKRSAMCSFCLTATQPTQFVKFLDEDQFVCDERSEPHLHLREKVKQHLVLLKDEVARWRQDPNFAVTEAMTGSAYELRGYIKLHEYLARKFTTKVCSTLCTRSACLLSVSCYTMHKID
jgi:Ca2+-binding EF-hand superfamily protein